MTTFSIHHAQKNLSQLIQKAAAGEEVIIVRGAKPVARLVAFCEAGLERVPGSLNGKLIVGPKFFEPLPESQLAQWE
jgi:prevent-host-death family protein